VARPSHIPYNGRKMGLVNSSAVRERVIACIEEPALIARILGHVQQRLESDNKLARVPPRHQEQTFNLI